MGLFGNKAPTAKFAKIGDSCSGVIVAFDKQQRTEYLRGGGVGDPMYWYNSKPTPGVAVDPKTGEQNKPVMDDVITVDTGVPDEFGQTERRLFVKGRSDLEAIRAACQAAGVRDVELGGRLTKTWMSGAGGTEDPRGYAYTYAPPGGFGEAVAGVLGRPISEETQAALTRQVDSAKAAADRLTAPKPRGTASTKAALGIADDSEPPF